MTVNRQAARSALGSAWQPVVHHASLDIAVIARPRSGRGRHREAASRS
jgi:hypothetical protein